jgi:hypothetical protein
MGFKLISTAKFLAGNDDVVVMLEKKVDNETISVLTSTEVRSLHRKNTGFDHSPAHFVPRNLYLGMSPAYTDFE